MSRATSPRILPLAATAALALSLGMAGTASARTLTFIPDDRTIDAPGNSITSTATFIGFGSPADLNDGTNPTSPTIEIAGGGSVSGNIQAYNSSILNIAGGLVDGGIGLRNSSELNLLGGEVTGSLSVQDSSRASLSGGTLNAISANGSALAQIGGGVEILGNATASAGSGTLSISGGTIRGRIGAGSNGTVNLSGGTIDGVVAELGLNYLYSGGGNSVLNIHGFNLGKELVDSFPGNNVFRLSGTLLDGTSLDGRYISLAQSGNSVVNLIPVPEPSTLAMAGLPTLLGLIYGWLRGRRRRALLRFT